MLLLISVWWAAMLLARALDLALPWVISATSAHVLLMSLGFMPFFFIGFLFTAGPKWLALPEVPARKLLPSVLMMLSGWVIALIGFHTGVIASTIGLILVALGWSLVCLKFVVMVKQSRASDRVHATLIALACCMGVIAMWVAAFALWIEHEPLLRSAAHAALWCFVATVFTVVSHRMLPFFSAASIPLLDAWRPMWLLGLMVSVLWLQAPFAVAELWYWPLPSAVRWMQVAIELPFAALLLWLALRWGLLQSLKIRLLAMLHGGFVWLGIAFMLAATSHALMAFTAGDISLGLAPLHALTMGYLGSTLLAMVTRVSSGHGGRPLTADNFIWTLYGVLQTAIFLRVIAALWPSAATPFTLLSVLAWTAVAGSWALRYGGWFGRPRPDGRAG